MDDRVGVQEEDVEASWTLLPWLASCLMVFGGALPYVPQYQDIQRSSNTEGFSTRVCLVLLIANILRIFFWIGKQFELTLLLQSVVMILTMFAMLHLCCTIQNTNRSSTFTQKESRQQKDREGPKRCGSLEVRAKRVSSDKLSSLTVKIKANVGRKVAQKGPRAEAKQGERVKREEKRRTEVKPKDVYCPTLKHLQKLLYNGFG